MKLFNLKNLMASGRQCGVAFIIAAVVHGFLTAGAAEALICCPAVGARTAGIAIEAVIIGTIGIALLFAGSIQLPGGNSQ